MTLTADRQQAQDADGLVVPGVGAFAACMDGLRRVRGHEVIGRRLAGGRPVLGICVGMQVLFDRGVEHGVETDGCDEWPGVVERLQAPVVPHMGWNTVEAPEGSALFAGVEDERFYFVHSYGVRRWELETHGRTRPPRDLGRARRRPVRRRGRERSAVGDPVPPREVRRRRGRAAEQLGGRPVSKERAQRRAEREREAAVKAAARARTAERRARATARKRTLTGWLPRPHVMPGTLAARRRREIAATIAILVALNVLVWIMRPEWSARLGALVVSVLVAPILHLFVRRP